MSKINLREFIANMDIVMAYATNHMVNEDWAEYTDSMFVDDTFEEMQYYVLAMKKCREHMETIKRYEQQDRNKRGNLFLDA